MPYKVPHFLVVDLFCGAGGTSRGFKMAGELAKVIACVNHDHVAIKSHWSNYPEVKHYEEDIRTLDVTLLAKDVLEARKKHPQSLLILWASLECTNHSNAKGGISRDADSRTLAEHLDRYIKALRPDYIQIENVVEFAKWGPLVEKVDGTGNVVYDTKKGTPIMIPDKNKLGVDFVSWCKKIDSLGYYNEWKQMNSADFGSYTSRNRLFGCFARHHLPITFPKTTHHKKGLHGLKKWAAVKDVLRLDLHGNSIFNRKKPLVENTLERIYEGLKKFTHEAFISNYKSGHPSSKNTSIDRPFGTITTIPTHSIVQPQSIGQYDFLSTYYGNGGNNSVEEPAKTLTTKDRLSKICVQYIYRDFSNSGFAQSIESPAGSLTTVPKINLVTGNFIINPQYSNKGHSIHKPCPTIIASQKSYPLGVVSFLIDDRLLIVIKESDSPMTVKIKKFMQKNGIYDVKTRMALVEELKLIQGFPSDYILCGNQVQQKKAIGNSVEPNVVKHWIKAMYHEIVTPKFR